jgi:hypothetical protein
MAKLDLKTSGRTPKRIAREIQIEYRLKKIAAFLLGKVDTLLLMFMPLGPP